jgi:hypothetical protein
MKAIQINEWSEDDRQTASASVEIQFVPRDSGLSFAGGINRRRKPAKS